MPKQNYRTVNIGDYGYAPPCTDNLTTENAKVYASDCICVVCGRGPVKDGVSVFRQNDFSCRPEWACLEHCAADKRPDEETLKLVTAIAGLPRV